MPILGSDYAATNHTRRDRYQSGKIRVSQVNLTFQTQVGDDESGGILPFYRATTMSRFV
jgi:hypothetical protein